MWEQLVRGRRRNVMAAIVGAAVVAALAGTAAAGIVSSLGVATRTVAGKPAKIVVDRRGDTVYELAGESLTHLRCVTSQCLKLWPAVEVRSAGVTVPVATGVRGQVGILRRVKGNLYQLMLDHHPLYFYTGDTTIGFTKGEGIRSFGGTWHVVKAG